MEIISCHCHLKSQVLRLILLGIQTKERVEIAENQREYAIRTPSFSKMIFLMKKLSKYC